MKKILALILCALMMLGGAVAETGESAWRVTVDEIVVVEGSETIALNPAVEVLFGCDAAGYWAQLAVKLDGENAAAVQLEYAGDVITGSADGANDVLVIDGAEMFLNQYEMTGEDIRGFMNFALAGMGDLCSLLSDMNSTGIHVEQLSDNSARIALEESISLRLTWESIPAQIPFDLSQKNPARYTFREMFPGDGTDIPEALSASLMKLLADESVQKCFNLFTEIYGTSARDM